MAEDISSVGRGLPADGATRMLAADALTSAAPDGHQPRGCAAAADQPRSPSGCAADHPRSPSGYTPILRRLFDNYSMLYLNFMGLNLWAGGWKQVVMIVPFIVIGPQLFDLHQPIAIGVLVRVADVFTQLFFALSVAMDNWAQVNEWRSVCRRLSEFEAAVSRSHPVETRRGHEALL